MALLIKRVSEIEYKKGQEAGEVFQIGRIFHDKIRNFLLAKFESELASGKALPPHTVNFAFACHFGLRKQEAKAVMRLVGLRRVKRGFLYAPEGNGGGRP
jgi:hypothetical protein